MSSTSSTKDTMEVINTLRVQDIEDCFRVIKSLGQGSYGQVVLAEDRTTGTPLAVKLQRKDRTDLHFFLSELSLSVTLSEHPNIIKTHAIFIDTPEYYIMTQELALYGTMHDLIKYQVGMPEDSLKRCAVQVSWALEYLHTRGLVHRDIKPDNILLMDPDCHNVKLGDFGLTRYAGSFVSMMSHIIPFMSPELCKLKSNECLILSPSVDTWAFGVLLFVGLTGYYPWEGATEEDWMYRLYRKWQQTAGLTPLTSNWETVTTEALNMFNLLFAEDPSSRHSVLTVLEHINNQWKAEMTYEILVVEEEEDSVTVIIEADEEDQLIIIEQEEDITSSPGNNLIIVLSENDTLTIGAEVDIP